MANTVYNYGAAQTASGVYSFPNTASFFPDENTATQDTPISSGSSYPNSTLAASQITDIPSSATTNSTCQWYDVGCQASNGLSSFATWIEQGFADTAIRAGVVILGFILVAIGLSMFKNTAISVSLKK